MRKGGGGGSVGGTVDVAILGGVASIFLHLLPLLVSLDYFFKFSSNFCDGTTNNHKASSLVGWKFIGHSIKHGQKSNKS